MTLQSAPTAWLLGVGLGLLAPTPGSGQPPPPVPYGAPPAPQYAAPAADLNGLAEALAGRVRHLGEDIATGLRRDPAAQHLLEDTQEMALAVDEFRATVRGTADPARLAPSFAGIDQTWQHLRGQLTRPGLGTDAVNRAIARVDELMGPLRQGLGINPPPPDYDGAGPAPAGVADVRRLAHALVSRSQVLRGAIQAGMPNDPNQAALLNDATLLAQLADTFHDTIDANQPVEVAARAFAPVDQVADRVERFVGAGSVPPPVRQAWQDVAAVEVLIHQELGINAPPPAGVVPLGPPPGGGPGPMVGLSAQLVGQVQAYEATFRATAHNVPEGFAALSDARRLLAAAADFQQDAARGLPPNQLAYEFRDVDAQWQRLARRAGRIARGRNGPFIQQVEAIGGTCQQIHSALGMVGSPPPPSLYGPGSPPPPPPGSGQPF